MYKLTITVDEDSIDTDSNDMDTLLACLAGLEQRIIDLANYDDSAYEAICAVTSAIVFEDSFVE